MTREKRGQESWAILGTEAQSHFSSVQVLCAIWQLTWGRPVWTWQTLVVFLLVGLAVCIVAAYRWLFRQWLAHEFVSEVLSPVYLGFLLPICCLSSGAQVLGGAWEEGWLMWLLLRPLPRAMLYGLLLLAAIPWTLLMTLGTALVLGAVAGSDAFQATYHMLGVLAVGTLAYLTLFVFFSVLFRRATLVSVAYVFVVENFIGYMPGLISHGSINFYLRSLLAHSGWEFAPSGDSLFPFQATSCGTAWFALIVATLAWTLLGAVLFERREYADPAV